MRNIFRKASKPLDDSSRTKTAIDGIDKEQDFHMIALLVFGASEIYGTVQAKEILDGVDVAKLVGKIYREQDIGQIGALIAAAARADSELAKRIVERLDAARFVEKIAACSTDAIRLCVGNMWLAIFGLSTGEVAYDPKSGFRFPSTEAPMENADRTTGGQMWISDRKVRAIESPSGATLIEITKRLEARGIFLQDSKK